MVRSLILTAALLSTSSFAQDAGSLADAGSAVVVMPPLTLVVSADGGVTMAPDVAAAASLVKTVFTGVKAGNWWLAAGAFLVLVVSLLRTAGKKFHEWLPDDNILDKPLLFLYDTKIGGWILNWLTATAGGIGTAMAAGVPVDASLWKSVVMVSTSASALFELYSDLMAWWKARAAKKAVAAVPAPPAVAPVEPPKP